MPNNTFNKGYIETITGTMFSGKSQMLLERGKRANDHTSYPVYYFKPKGETKDIHSRNGFSKNAISVEAPMEMFVYLQNKKEGLVLVDETQFFDTELLYIAKKISLLGFNIVFAGLDKDYRGMPFPIMALLIAISNKRHFTQNAVCDIAGCHRDGILPQRLRNDYPDSAMEDTYVEEGSEDSVEYQPRCHKHHIVPDLERFVMTEYDTIMGERYVK